jgi:hypothetical protein
MLQGLIVMIGLTLIAIIAGSVRTVAVAAIRCITIISAGSLIVAARGALAIGGTTVWGSLSFLVLLAGVAVRLFVTSLAAVTAVNMLLGGVEDQLVAALAKLLAAGFVRCWGLALATGRVVFDILIVLGALGPGHSLEGGTEIA